MARPLTTRTTVTLLAGALSVTVVLPSLTANQQATDYTLVTDERLRNPAPDD